MKERKKLKAMQTRAVLILSILIGVLLFFGCFFSPGNFAIYGIIGLFLTAISLVFFEVFGNKSRTEP